MRKILLHPPIWLERILRHFTRYRSWYINEVCKILKNDALEQMHINTVNDSGSIGGWTINEEIKNE